jgi:hypothetical protein
MEQKINTTTPKEVGSADLLYRCEKKALKLFYGERGDLKVWECRAEIEKEFGKDVVNEMMRNGIGGNKGKNWNPTS